MVSWFLFEQIYGDIAVLRSIGVLWCLEVVLKAFGTCLGVVRGSLAAASYFSVFPTPRGI